MDSSSSLPLMQPNDDVCAAYFMFDDTIYGLVLGSKGLVAS